MQVPEIMFIGVDVAKSTLSVCVHSARGHRELRNDEASIRRWLASLPPSAVIAVESTGRYYRTLIGLTTAAGHRAFVLNASDVHFYAKGLGARGKTDRTDAQVIARYVAEHHATLKPWRAATPTQEQLRELLRCRAKVTTNRIALRQTLQDVKGLESAVLGLERGFDAILADIDHQVAALVAADPKLSHGCAALRTISGFGPQGSSLVATLLSRLNFANADALVAYTGLDPRPNDSGDKTGKRRLSKRGDPALRRQLYLAALSASRSNAFRSLYQSLKAKGFKPTQAHIILARKLLRIAWAVWKTGQPFDPSRHALPAAC